MFLTAHIKTDIMLMSSKYRASISALAISLTFASSSVVGVKNSPFKDDTTLSKRFLEETSEDTQTKRPRLSEAAEQAIGIVMDVTTLELYNYLKAGDVANKSPDKTAPLADHLLSLLPARARVRVYASDKASDLSAILEPDTIQNCLTKLMGEDQSDYMLFLTKGDSPVQRALENLASGEEPPITQYSIVDIIGNNLLAEEEDFHLKVGLAHALGKYRFFVTTNTQPLLRYDFLTTNEERLRALLEPVYDGVYNGDENAEYRVVRQSFLETSRGSLYDHFAKHPDKTLLLDVKGPKLTLRTRDLPPTLRKISISNVRQDVTSIDDFFLSGFNNLTALDLWSLSKVNKVGNYFLSYCTDLPKLDLSPLANVNEAGCEFLFKCNPSDLKDPRKLKSRFRNRKTP